MYRIIFTDLAKKQFLKLPRNVRERIKNSLVRIRISPFKHVKKLIGIPRYSLRVGSYRIIINIDKGKLVILVLEMGHRRKIYK